MRLVGSALVWGLAILLVGCANVTQAQNDRVALERVVVDDDRGVRAIITYRPYVLTGGQEEFVNSDGAVSMRLWQAFSGQFSAEITEGNLAELDHKAFLREAVAVVCPSVDHEQLGRERVQLDGAFLSIFAQCPEVDGPTE